MSFSDGTTLTGEWDKWQLSGVGSARCANGEWASGESSSGFRAMIQKSNIESTGADASISHIDHREQGQRPHFLTDHLSCPTSLPQRGKRGSVPGSPC